jgi:tryptophan 2,3-dioxygenase
MKKKVPNYWDYLNLKPLLSLQGGLENNEKALDTDELHFIITHQALELWFKLILAELRDARDQLSSPNVPEERITHVVHHLGRVSEILQLAAQTFSVMETLTPQDFMSFRDKLTPASGFQSFQMREMELLLGVEWDKRVKYGKVDPLDHIRKLAKDSPAGELALNRIEQVLQETSLKNAMHTWLYRTPVQGSQPTNEQDEQVIDQFLEEYVVAVANHHALQRDNLIASSVGSKESITTKFDTMTQQARSYLFAEDAKENQAFVKRYRAGLLFIESYRELPLLAWPRLLIDALVEVDSQMVMFRHRHARAVERIIGRRIGTGGSSGVNYLDETTKIRVFHDLWTVRTVLLPKKLRPVLQKEDFYRFRL